MASSPAFGQADLSNCERELIHLPGSIQPHGLLLVLAEPGLQVRQVSANVQALWQVSPDALLERPLARIDPALAAALDRRPAALAPDVPWPLQYQRDTPGGREAWDGIVHRLPGAGLLVELERVWPPAAPVAAESLPAAGLYARLGEAVQTLGGAPRLAVLADATVRLVRELTGYDRVMVYRFDPDGHGQVIAEARDPRVEPFLNHHYPASDIPQRARELYLRNRVRVLVDVHYQAVPLVPARLPDGQELDMSMCGLRSMSPLHLQYLQNMGVTATLVASLVHEGRLWGLIAAHHYQPRSLRWPLRAAVDVIAEVVSTRIAALEQAAQAQVAVWVRRLEQRLIEATSTEGDWREALMRQPRTLLQPLNASGAVLLHDGELRTAGEVPSTPELRALAAWLAPHTLDGPFETNAIARANPALASLTPLAAGVLAVRLARQREALLIWLRKEQLTTVTWAGDPHKPSDGDDPSQLSPRRSFAAWSEIVRGTALRWSTAERAMARAIGSALVDIMLQVDAVRLLIAEQQLKHMRAAVEASHEPVLIADAEGRVLFPNAALRALLGSAAEDLHTLADLARRLVSPAVAEAALAALQVGHAWRAEGMLCPQGSALGASPTEPVPVGIRADVVPGRDGRPIGVLLTLSDLRPTRRTAAARRQLEDSLARSARLGEPVLGPGTAAEPGPADPVVGSILANASLAAMDIVDGPAADDSTAQLLEGLEASTRRATAIYRRLRSWDATPPEGGGSDGR